MFERSSNTYPAARGRSSPGASREGSSMAMSLPVLALTFLGAIIAVLGFFAGGNIPLVVIGLGAIAVAGVLQVLGQRRG
jgi:hypothetical protein